MDTKIKKIVDRMYPDLANGYYTPMLGRVEKIQRTSQKGDLSTQGEPIYAADIQPLNHKLSDKGLIFKDLVLSLPYIGNQRGFFAYPEKGAIIEFCFAYGMPNLIFIRGVLPWGMQLPAVKENEALWQHSPACYQKYNKDGDWEQKGNINQHIAAIKNTIKAPKTWLGSDNENVLTIIKDFMTETAAALQIIASHKHSGGLPPNESGTIAAKSSNIDNIKTSRLTPIAE